MVLIASDHTWALQAYRNTFWNHHWPCIRADEMLCNAKKKKTKTWCVLGCASVDFHNRPYFPTKATNRMDFNRIHEHTEEWVGSFPVNFDGRAYRYVLNIKAIYNINIFLRSKFSYYATPLSLQFIDTIQWKSSALLIYDLWSWKYIVYYIEKFLR